MSVDKNPGLKSKRRTKKGEEEDRKRYIRLLAEEGGGISQNQIRQKLEDISWATVRRDLKRLIDEGLIKTEKGPRGAILHSLTGRGFVAYLTSTSRPFSSHYISEPNEDFESFKRRVNADRIERRRRLEKLIEIIEREGRKLDFPIFSEVKVLIDHLGEEAINAILEVSKSMEALMPFSNLSLYTENLLKQKKELVKHLKLVKKYPQVKVLIASRVGQKEEEKFEVDGIASLEGELNRTNTMITNALKVQENLWLQTFAELFFERISYGIKDNKNKIANEKLYRAAKDLLNRKKNELKFLETIVNLFKK